MSVSAKICGISTAVALDAAIGGGATHVGFVFFPKSPRNVSIEQAAGLAARVPGHVNKVGLFVEPNLDFLAQVLAVIPLEVIQLHGNESPSLLARLRSAYGLELWKAVPVRTRADLEVGKAYHGLADRLLYDAKPPNGAELPGGNGLRFDWKLLEGHRHMAPWALSGGLDPANAAEAARVTGAQLLDVSSGVESTPGVKDVDKIAAFLQAVASL